MADKGKKVEYHDERGGTHTFLDTNDPYILRDEAQEARDLLAAKYVKGAEFASDGNQLPFWHVMDLKAMGIAPSVCSIGAVYYVQGHHAFECNLIRALNAQAMRTPATKCSDCTCTDDFCRGEGTIVDINDELGLQAALDVFDAVIDDYQRQIAHAESMAMEYESKQRVAVPFTYSLGYTPVNYGTPTTAHTPATHKVKS